MLECHQSLPTSRAMADLRALKSHAPHRSPSTTRYKKTLIALLTSSGYTFVVDGLFLTTTQAMLLIERVYLV